MGTTKYANGTYLRPGGMWDVFTGGRAICPDGVVRTLKRIAITADTFFSIPAAVSVRGRTVSGYVTVDDTLNDDRSTVRFTATGRNADVLAQGTPRTFYIAYFAQGFPGEQASDPTRHVSVQALTDAFREFAHAVGRDYYDPYGTACATVYATDSEDTWAEAERFACIGIPFDYPSFLLSIGKRGGIKRENA